MEIRLLTAVTCVSLALLVCYVSSQNLDCDGNKWFGTPCIYKCRCTNDMCDTNGMCTSGARCQGGWFGPACQYADLAYNRATDRQVTDGNDDTCISTSSGSVTVTLDSSYVFTWMRVRVSRPDHLHHLTVQFGNGLSCVNPKNATVDDTTLDIYCDLSETVQSVTLTGEGVQYLCSVYISGGRNVALRQTTSQSGNYSERGTTFTSDKSVDGSTSGRFLADKSCSVTATNLPTTPNWNVTFSKPRLVNRYLVYSRTDTNEDLLEGFKLESFHPKDTRLFTYTNTPPSTQVVYTVSANVTSLIYLVNITPDYPTKSFLQMCEVEVYGDSNCEPGRYGRECEHTCNCAGGQPCFISTGGCPSGCAAGFYGESCDLPCKPGTYGQGCKTNCSEFCSKNSSDERSCDHINGTCLRGCESGYLEPTCTTPCVPGLYGVGCSNSCSNFCVKNTSSVRSCDHVSGACLHGCESGYQEPTCTNPCQRGRYGQDCSSTCSQFCVDTNKTTDSVCDHITGVCAFGCHSDHQASFCQANDAGSQVDADIIAAIVGSVVGAIVVGLVILAVILFMRRQNNAKPEAVGDNSMNRSTQAFSEETTQSTANNAKQRKLVDNKVTGAAELGQGADSSGVYYNSIPRSTVVSLDELEDFMATKDDNFFKSQFAAITVNQSAKMNVGLSSENKHKNRYKNICAYDHSRVHLIPNATKKHGDYINASYIEGHKSDEKFIASQGPTKVILEDFVRMLWEQEVEKVVMLTNLVEEGKQKCERYWPEDDEMKIGEITVKLTTTQVFADFTIRRLRLRKEGKQGQDLIHFHFTSWPDKDVPNTPWSLVSFEQKVASYPTCKPIVVHCSAGVGRTGTFIALRNVMRQAEETGQMDFFTTVQKLRHDRINMIQTAEQYKFLHKSAQVAMLCIGTTVTATDITNRIMVLETRIPTGQTKMEKEFNSVCSVCEETAEENTSEENPYNVYENSQNVVNRQKNRVNNILPKDMYRPKLHSGDSSGIGDYINAVLVPSFGKQNQQILTQLPLPTTITDFWRLVTQYKVTLIVAFEMDLRATDQTIGDYLPSSESHVVTSSGFSIKTEKVSTGKFWKQQKLIISMDAAMKKLANITSDHHMTHLTVTTTDLDKGILLAVTQQIRSKQLVDEGRTLYMCSNGADYSGLVYVLSLLLDRMDNDQCLTVPLVVGAVKSIRPQVIPTLDQYRLLYKVLKLYSESISEYSNFGGN